MTIKRIKPNLAQAREKLLGEVDSQKFSVRTEGGKSASAGEAIFPIVTQHPDGILESVGTGFFIGQQGLFVTAAHNITHVIDQDGKPRQPLGMIQFMPGSSFFLRPFRYVTRHTIADVALGIAYPLKHNITGEHAPNPVLTLSNSKPTIGTPIHTFAYPKAKIIPGTPQKAYFSERYFEGMIEGHFPEGRDKTLLPGPCFQTSMSIHGGASGGPVFGPHGFVIGINSTGYDDSNLSFVSCISSLLDLRLANLKLAGETTGRYVSVAELIPLGFVSAR